VWNQKKNSLLAALIRAAHLVIWDEAPMQSRHIYEAVDCTFQDVQNSDRPFRGLCVVFGGDFKQILPVVIKGNQAQIVGIYMQRCTLWQSIQVLKLTQNMRLNAADEHEHEFAQWQLDIGHRRHADENGDINLPDHLHCGENTIESLIQTIYPGITYHVPPTDQYFAERTLLASCNDDVDSINKDILRQFPGEVQTFLSADSIKNNNGEGGQEVLMYPVQYLNTINCSGLIKIPLHKLELKKGCPVMVLRNLNPEGGVCSGSRGIVTRCWNQVLGIRLITGQHAGETVFIPRIPIRNLDSLRVLPPSISNLALFCNDDQ
jgi:ATP-dependent DNA helicase PIF1